MELSVTTPSLLFPAISLMMLAHTNRFIALASVSRTLSDRYRADTGQTHLLLQLKNLRNRLRMLRSVQALSVLSFLLCVMCMGFIMLEWPLSAVILFAVSLLSFAASLILSLMEIMRSLKALETDLIDLESSTQPCLTETMLPFMVRGRFEDVIKVAIRKKPPTDKMGRSNLSSHEAPINFPSCYCMPISLSGLYLLWIFGVQRCRRGIHWKGY